ncbi:MAG TPA: SMI1/KNR4 family protein, partial [Fimbriimonas sp.]|nr:SMI1/KNR4 family protein [Fimbriimonas sp.]
MPIADLLQRLQEIPSVTVQPPAPHAERNVEGVAGAPLPADYRDLLEQCSAIDGLSIEVDFTGEAFDFGFEEAFPYKVTFAGDGIGNFWIADVAEPSADSPIFFACHDPPIVLFQCRGVETFLKE